MEIEAKFRIPDEGTFQRLLETKSLAGFSLGKASLAQLHDQYLDTKDRAIGSHGYAYRLRKADDHYLATLKGLGEASGAVHRRVELEAELPDPAPPHLWPDGEARNMMLRLGGSKPLVVLFEIEQARHTRPVYEADRNLAELNVDRVHVRSGDDVIANYLELEAELLSAGHDDDLRRLVAELQDAWSLVPETKSKYERALGALGEPPDASSPVDTVQCSPTTAEPEQANETAPAASGAALPERREGASPPPELEGPGLEPDEPMSEAGRKIFRYHYRRMIQNEPGTRLGEDIEALHDMRVATRRMRAAFRVFGDYYDKSVVAPYLKGLKRTGRTLGDVRDLDVFRAKMQTYLDSLPQAQQQSLDDLAAVLDRQRQICRRRLIAYLDSEKYDSFVGQFEQFVEMPGMGSLNFTPEGRDPIPHRVRHVAPMAIYRRLAAVRAYDEWVTIPDPPLTRLHALRISCKRLRYTLEFFEEVLGPDTKTLIKEIVAMQDHLGALQDAVVASGILRDFLTYGTWGHSPADELLPNQESPIVAPGVAEYLAAKQVELQHLLDTFPEAWRRFNGEPLGRMAAEAVMVL